MNKTFINVVIALTLFIASASSFAIPSNDNILTRNIQGIWAAQENGVNFILEFQENNEVKTNILDQGELIKLSGNYIIDSTVLYITFENGVTYQAVIKSISSKVLTVQMSDTGLVVKYYKKDSNE